ncbi:hypothetical protein AVEN_112202-1 [Araneus ventricosus]|uniref:Uncharacterized protein n=1 Tax=Araneus ventricosus TaxID=182803 RepID=A0A4Y2PDZ7_ARAVE|nr:hypothetical protein AVEN_112202-1 [Araneus ventricosus]
MSKVREIPRALHVPKALLDASFNAVATSSTDVGAIAFLPLSHFTSNEPDSSNLSIIFFRPNAVIRPEPLLKPFIVRNFFIETAVQSPFLQKSFTSRARSFNDRVMTTFSDAE